jgi:hypothetical protein
MFYKLGFMPFCNVNRDGCFGFGVWATYGCLSCGHNAVCLEIKLALWTLLVGIEKG